jgi:gamma-glutamylcyclotransferase (GGCT)/AIG2-like uncharacterized protein YtfP
MDTESFFVYGTLKVGGRFAQQFDDVRVSSVKAEVEGFDLWHLGSFPGIKPGAGKVIGELHEYKDPEKVTRRMDSIEGYMPDIKDGMYLRKRVSVKTEDGGIKEANIYVFNLKVPPRAKKLDSGIWELPKR